MDSLRSFCGIENIVCHNYGWLDSDCVSVERRWCRNEGVGTGAIEIRTTKYAYGSAIK